MFNYPAIIPSDNNDTGGLNVSFEDAAKMFWKCAEITAEATINHPDFGDFSYAISMQQENASVGVDPIPMSKAGNFSFFPMNLRQEFSKNTTPVYQITGEYNDGNGVIHNVTAGFTVYVFNGTPRYSLDFSISLRRSSNDDPLGSLTWGTSGDISDGFIPDTAIPLYYTFNDIYGASLVFGPVTSFTF